MRAVTTCGTSEGRRQTLDAASHLTALVHWLWNNSRLTIPRRLTFSWWGCYSLCPRHKPTELAHSSLFHFCVCFYLYGPFDCISFHKFPQQLSCFLTLFFWCYFCLIGLFSYIALYRSLPQP